jgi:class 3 adenylate cyclase
MQYPASSIPHLVRTKGVKLRQVSLNLGDEIERLRESYHGAILVSRPTADRVKELFPLTPLGKFSLKNVSAQVEIFEV